MLAYVSPFLLSCLDSFGLVYFGTQTASSKNAAARVSPYLHEYASQKGIYMKINYVNPEHVHAPG